MKPKVFIGHVYLQDKNGKIWALRVCPDGALELTNDEFTEQEKLEIKENSGILA
jgi:hypothetical protein